MQRVKLQNEGTNKTVNMTDLEWKLLSILAHEAGWKPAALPISMEQKKVITSWAEKNYLLSLDEAREMQMALKRISELHNLDLGNLLETLYPLTSQGSVRVTIN
ncbi:MAG: hypothetical protein BWY41_00038 [Candidatus Atribacteria bacterium ADurb.Bin276]|uniref:Uncharacterized protein n=1 Tax=Candidatus Atribacter allofermentans TaxID=1852833 RepID=A0A1V5T4D6_9BACT|nr:MAG: hypothetical protein BWY41_00038 [Candidatus Atribacteria bacterium ADurb.Bin276]